MSNHTPATPLPWKPASGRANEGMGAPVETELRGADRQVAVRLGTLYSDRQKQDADYIEHAANSYPNLVKAAQVAIAASRRYAALAPDEVARMKGLQDVAFFSDLLDQLGEDHGPQA